MPTILNVLLLFWLSLGYSDVLAQTNTNSSTAFKPLFSQAAIPDEQNAALLFQKAAALLVIPDNEYDLLPGGRTAAPTGNRPLPPAVSNILAKVVDGNAGAMSEFKKAAALKQSAYPIDWSKGAATPVPHLNQIRRSSKFFGWSCLLHAVRGNEEAALESVLLGFALAQSLETEAIIISQAVRARVIGDAVENLEQTINRIRVSDSSLTRFQKKLTELERQQSDGILFSNALAADERMFASLFEYPVSRQRELLIELLTMAQSKNIEDPVRIREIEQHLIDTSKADQQFFLQTQAEMKRLWAAPYPARLMVLEYRKSKAEEAKKQELLRTYVSLFHFHSPPLAAEAHALISLRLGRIAVALEQYRRDHHQLYPPFLSHLTPKYLEQVPIDPADGKPLRYRKAGRGYSAWSIGGSNLKSWPPAKTAFTVVSAPQSKRTP